MYKILSLDGGGSWAILQLLTLKDRFKDEIPDLKGHKILQQFDFVIANSGGSIVLAALAENMSVDEAIELFSLQSNREMIFHKNSFWDSFFPVSFTRKFLGSKYSTEKKELAFKKLFPKIDAINMDKLPEHIGKESLKIVVCTFDALNNRAKFFKSYTQPNSNEEYIPLTKAIHGSSNAPVQYFDFPAKVNVQHTGMTYYLWDGALGGFNNPVVAGIIEAIRSDISSEDIILISLGTGNKLMSKEQKNNFYSSYSIALENRSRKFKLSTYKAQIKYFMNTVTNQAKTILFQPPDWSNYVAFMFLAANNGKNVADRFIRLSPIIHYDKNSPIEMEKLIDILYDMDMDLTAEKDIQMLFQCYEDWKNGNIKNQPIEFSITLENELQYKTGDKTYELAMNRWKQIFSLMT